MKGGMHNVQLFKENTRQVVPGDCTHTMNNPPHIVEGKKCVLKSKDRFG